jgi:2-keto-4-pentenoate hydratase/2-oxohepta-3-ene-1,7-dioic acid hydratase in catechol pathway
MFFSFFDLLRHASKTRRLTAGTIIGTHAAACARGAVALTCSGRQRHGEQRGHVARLVVPGREAHAR